MWDNHIFVEFLPSFFSIVLSEIQVLMAVSDLLDFFSKNHYLQGGFIFQWQVCFSVREVSFLSGEACPIGGISFDGGFSNKIMPLTRRNPGMSTQTSLTCTDFTRKTCTSKWKLPRPVIWYGIHCWTACRWYVIFHCSQC